MTYRELAERIARMSEEQKDCDVTVFDNNFEEFFGGVKLKFSKFEDNDVLDENHPYLLFP